MRTPMPASHLPQTGDSVNQRHCNDEIASVTMQNVIPLAPFEGSHEERSLSRFGDIYISASILLMTTKVLSILSSMMSSYVWKGRVGL